jgi:AcrR family transcriptional regulator
MATAPTRQSAEQRRETVLAAAIEEFARGGLGGTSTQSIAERAGISQPYLFRLFPTKKDLFLAAVERTHRRIVEQFEAAVGDRTGEDALAAMGAAYGELITDRKFLLMQLASYAACDDEQVRAISRRGFRDVWYAAERLSGASPELVQKFYAYGMLWNVVTAMQLDEIPERWAKLACAFTEKSVPGR